MARLAVFGARSLALGIEKAVTELYPVHKVICFLVSTKEGNRKRLDNLPVIELRDFREYDVHILVGTPEDTHPEIIDMLEQSGFHSYTCIDSGKEADLLERYYKNLGLFPSINILPAGKEKAALSVFAAKSYKDRPLKKTYDLPGWLYPLQAGADLENINPGVLTDHTGDNISEKNVNYCELTALYWIWKNCLLKMPAAGKNDYYGLFHYRRLLDISDVDLQRLVSNHVDVVLQYPTLHEPNISEHHERYVSEEDWQAMLQALREQQPEYRRVFSEILSLPYFYNHNLIIARKDILANYCAWLFPVLERTEELSSPKGWERSDRYIGYLGENLMTLYFMYHKTDLHIVHTGRKMLT